MPVKDLNATQEVKVVPPPEAVAGGPDPEQSMPLFEAARRLGEGFWTKKIVDGGTVNGQIIPVVTYDGPSWQLAGAMASAKLDEHSMITQSELKALVKKAHDFTIGRYTHSR
jgi:hypothetical protein